MSNESEVSVTGPLSNQATVLREILRPLPIPSTTNTRGTKRDSDSDVDDLMGECEEPPRSGRRHRKRARTVCNRRDVQENSREQAPTQVCEQNGEGLSEVQTEEEKEKYAKYRKDMKALKQLIASHPEVLDTISEEVLEKLGAMHPEDIEDVLICIQATLARRGDHVISRGILGILGELAVFCTGNVKIKEKILGDNVMVSDLSIYVGQMLFGMSSAARLGSMLMAHILSVSDSYLTLFAGTHSKIPTALNDIDASTAIPPNEDSDRREE